MKIQIHEKDGLYLTLLFPTTLIGLIAGSRVAGKIIYKSLQGIPLKNHAKISDETSEEIYLKLGDILTEGVLRKAQKELKKLLKKYKHLTLVDVQSADGDTFKIIL